MKLTKRNILENFDDGTYSRGFEYYKSKLVAEYDVQEDEGGDIFVESIVEGSEIYSQEISLVDFNDMLINSDCSCPVGHNCKHAVAVLFQMLPDD